MIAARAPVVIGRNRSESTGGNSSCSRQRCRRMNLRLAARDDSRAAAIDARDADLGCFEKLSAVRTVLHDQQKLTPGKPLETADEGGANSCGVGLILCHRQGVSI